MSMKSICHGRLARKIELSYTNNNVPFCRFQLAYDRYVGGDKGTVTEYPTFIAWRNVAERLEKYTQKGSDLVVFGQYTSYKKKIDGQQYPITIVEFSVDDFEFCGSKKESGTNTAPTEPPAPPANAPVKNTKNTSTGAMSHPAAPSYEDFEEIEGEEDDLPF